MKLLLIGSDHIWSIEKVYQKYLSALQQEVSLFAAQNEFYEFYNRSILNKIAYRAGLSRVIPRINIRLRERISRIKPDAVLVFKGMEVLPETLEWMREQKIVLANYNPDNPFIFTGSGSGNKNVTAGIPLYDLHFTYNLQVKERLEREYGVRTAVLPFGFDIDPGLYESCREQEETAKVCFLGNPDADRAALLNNLLERGVRIDVYGHHWDKFIQHDNLRIPGAVYGDEFWKTLWRYRVQLNLMRIHNLQSHNMRTFEIPGIGAIELAPDTPEHRQFFTPDREIFLYRDAGECYDKIKQLLGLSPAAAALIRQAARTKSVEAGYSYRDRARQVVDCLQELL
jgi:spore maturation protein CgeB